MLRKVLIGGLAAIVIAAAGAGAYQAFAGSSSSTTDQAAAASTSTDGVLAGNQGSGGNGYHGGSAEPHGDGTGVPSPQANAGELFTFEGTVASVAGNTFTMDTETGPMNVQLGNSYYVESLGMNLAAGDDVTVTGFWETETTFAAQKVAVGDDTFVLREESGRPMWAGGGQNGGGGNH